MMYILIQYIIIVIVLLINIALLTLIERKVMASAQRRLGPITTCYAGIAQPITDGVKLAIKQIVTPTHGYVSLFYISAIISLFTSLFIWTILPLSHQLLNVLHNVLLILAITSISIYGLLLSGWSSNCMYTILGSIRSSAQLISYELSVTLLLISIIISDSFDINNIQQSQRQQWNIITYFPIFITYFITILAETNRAPFDLSEAESELVSGFNTEHSALPFAYFFLAEYGFIISQSYILVYVFLGGQYIPYIYIPYYFLQYILAIKAWFIVFIIVLIRATLPRLRYDLLQYLAWNILLPFSITYFTITITFIT